MSTKVEGQKKEDMRKKVEFRVACEEKAFRIVEKLIENPVEEKHFLDSAQFITPEHYADIIEERAVSSLCGYPLCPNPLGQVPKQKYTISTKNNKVYDIGGRKNFCSNKCYKASTFFEKQISTVPVWTRQIQPPVNFQLLPFDNIKTGKVGEVVMVSNRDSMLREVTQLERMDHYQEALQNCLHGNKVKGHPQGQGTDQDSNSDLSSEEEVDDNEKEVHEYTLEKVMSEMDIGTDSDGIDITGKEKPEVKRKDVGRSSDRKRKSETGLSQYSKEETNFNSQCKSSESKHEYLMRLMDKKKSLLSKMVDIQNASPESVKTEKEMSGEETTSSDNVKVKVSEVKDIHKTSCLQKEVEVTEIVQRVTERFPKLKISESKPEKTAMAEMGKMTDSGQDSHTSTREEKKERPVGNILELICRGVREWMTSESVKYLKRSKEPEVETFLKSSTYEEKYQSLVASVDARERDFNDLLGEEDMENDSDERPCGRLPHFDVLKEETEEMTLKVREFLKGSFTYKKEKKEAEVKKMAKDPDVRDRGDIVLPRIDRYDVILIRQKLVLDKVNRVLPELLSPLRLLTQDVFTELKELVMTFNLSRENILYKPAEWMLICLLLLKLISRKVRHVEEAFQCPSAQTYLGVLFKGIGQTSAGLEDIVDRLLVVP